MKKQLIKHKTLCLVLISALLSGCQIFQVKAPGCVGEFTPVNTPEEMLDQPELKIEGLKKHESE